MLVLHHLQQSRSQRILWLLEELGVPYEIKTYARDLKASYAPPELKAIHPLGKSPVITDDGNTIAESGAIAEYILDRYAGDRLRPKRGTPEHLRFTHFMHYAEGSAMPPLTVALIFKRIEEANVPFFVKPIVRGIVSKVRASYIAPALATHFGYVNDELKKSLWLAGNEFSAADIHMSYPIEAAVGRAGLGPTHPKLVEFLERIHARPAYQRAEAAGGPFTLIG